MEIAFHQKVNEYRIKHVDNVPEKRVISLSNMASNSTCNYVYTWLGCLYLDTNYRPVY